MIRISIDNHQSRLRLDRPLIRRAIKCVLGRADFGSGKINVYVVGETTGNLTEPDSQSPPVYDAFVRKYDAAGEHQWTRQFGATGQDFARGVSTDGQGNVFVAGANPNGAFVSKYDATGILEWMRQLRAMRRGPEPFAADAGRKRRRHLALEFVPGGQEGPVLDVG